MFESEYLSALPIDAAELQDEAFELAHHRVQQKNLMELNRERPHVGLDVYSGVNFIDIPSLDHDPSEAVVVPYPFATGNTSAMYVTLKHLHESLDKQQRVIGFLSNTALREHHPFRSALQHEDVSGGSLLPVAATLVDVLERQKVETAHVVGIEQGASVGAAVLEAARNRPALRTPSALLIEPPNVTEREPAELLAGMRATPLRRQRKATAENNLPALKDAHPELFGSKIMQHRHRRFQAKTRRSDIDHVPVNQDIIKALGKNTFAEDCSYTPDVNKLLVRGSKSRICPSFEPADADANKPHQWPDKTTIIELENAGHEVIHRVIDISLLARYVIRQS